MSVKNPTAATRILLGRRDVAVRYVGDSLLIIRCYSIKPKTIHEDHRLADKRYELLPIKVNNQLMFMTPLDHDLVAHSPDVPCPWTPPKQHQKNETLDILSDNYGAMVAFTAAKSPETEIEMMNLALDHT
ncbi:hypothetical protein Tcan_14205 [Toxocara canis]|uniref:Uncharacterized protein n=1 Tax=Toxocara canis TaxID=6265 RepID=A0A0B2VNH9_TOXCA|nr:hypothetical protein Tcan_14205 [Toxocara canis]